MFSNCIDRQSQHKRNRNYNTSTRRICAVSIKSWYNQCMQQRHSSYAPSDLLKRVCVYRIRFLFTLLASTWNRWLFELNKSMPITDSWTISFISNFSKCWPLCLRLCVRFSPWADMLGSSADLSSMEGMVYDSSGTNGSASGGGGGGGSSSQQQQQQQRTKRMRTSFKHHQLRTMKSYFAINQNPDAKDLKQLAQKTGLSKRVLQVKTTIDFLI